jgi:Na+/phosphate symporter
VALNIINQTKPNLNVHLFSLLYKFVITIIILPFVGPLFTLKLIQNEEEDDESEDDDEGEVISK